MRDALTLSLLWTLAIGAVAGLPLSVGIAYSLLRTGDPPAERRARELYLTLLEEELHGEQCFSCRARVDPDWLRCPVCTTELRGRCHACDATVKLHWSTCPWCAESLLRLPETEQVLVAHPELAHPPRPIRRPAEHAGAAAA